MTFEKLIRQQRSHIDQVIGDLARCHYFGQAEVDEFRAAMIGALERNDFELLRAFDGRSTWETYLTLVVTREFFLFQMSLWGQWRPSPAAKRLGAAGVLLEELVVRDRLLVTEAIETMRTRHRVDVPRYRLMQMAEQLQLAEAAAGEGHTTLAVPPPEPMDPRVQTALADAWNRLSPDDRLIAELRFRDGQPLTRIARMMNLDVRPVQRRLDHAKEVIASSLMDHGVLREDVEALLASAENGCANPHHKWWQSVLSRPSNWRTGYVT